MIVAHGSLRGELFLLAQSSRSVNKVPFKPSLFIIMFGKIRVSMRVSMTVVQCDRATDGGYF